ncbi:putative RxLR effector [Phytophthora palmivora]|uniref:RxLR effector n=1 Tax=Phytophthora palmivora TaxID=4796 RepID=A0A2P4X3Z0_9STRA|nr:putative RxLR effector [Phytophthora palmivora]
MPLYRILLCVVVLAVLSAVTAKTIITVNNSEVTPSLGINQDGMPIRRLLRIHETTGGDGEERVIHGC